MSLCYDARNGMAALSSDRPRILAGNLPMDSNLIDKRFDALARSLAPGPSRRGLLATVTSGLLAGLGLTLTRDDATAKCKKPCGVCKRCKKGKCKRKPAGAACPGGSCADGKCVPAADPCPTSCAPINAACVAGCPGSCCAGGQCGCVNGTCTCRRLTCGGEDESCVNKADCCQGSCGYDGTSSHFTCRAATCQAVGDVCAATSDCCFGNCGFGGAAGAGHICREAGCTAV